MAAMKHCNSVSAPAYTTSLVIDTHGASFNELCKYSTVIYMLMYLPSNSCTNIAFALHQCKCFTHAPHQSHYKSVKYIICYIKVTENKFLIPEPSQNLQVNCYVDVDFSVI